MELNSHVQDGDRVREGGFLPGARKLHTDDQVWRAGWKTCSTNARRRGASIEPFPRRTWERGFAGAEICAQMIKYGEMPGKLSVRPFVEVSKSSSRGL